MIPFARDLDATIDVSVRTLCENVVTVKLSDSVSTVFRLLNIPPARILYNGNVLCPAMTFAYYGIENGASLVVIQAPPPQMRRSNSHNRFNQELTAAQQKTLQVRRFFEERCVGRVNDPDSILQRFHDAVNPMTSGEHARLTDLYKNRIETNTKAFRKLCAKFHSLVQFESVRPSSATPVPTVLPGKAVLPSTEFLPELLGPSLVRSETPQPFPNQGM